MKRQSVAPLQRVNGNSFPRLMRLGCFRFGLFFRGLLIRVDPFRVEHTGFIDTLVSVGTEEIAL
jgi:hypothetical protein